MFDDDLANFEWFQVINILFLFFWDIFTSMKPIGRTTVLGSHTGERSPDVMLD